MKGEYISIETSKIMADIEKENKELHEKIDKAIEYIEENAPWEEETEDGDFVSGKLLQDDDIDYVLEILKGE